MAAPELTSHAVSRSETASHECHLARVQLRRYMAGDEIPEQLLEELRHHLSECEGCKSESVRLRDALASVAPGTSPAPGASADTGNSGLVGRLLARIPAVPEGRLKSALKAPKTVGMSIGLAVVVVLLSTVFRNPTAALGPKASESATLSSEAEPTSEAATTHASNPGAEESSDSIDHGDEKPDPSQATDSEPLTTPRDALVESTDPTHESDKELRDEPPVTPVLGGKVVIAGGSPTTAQAKPSAPTRRTTPKPRATVRKLTTRPHRTRATPQAKPAAQPKPSGTSGAYVKVYD